jgi:hypothetical protein
MAVVPAEVAAQIWSCPRSIRLKGIFLMMVACRSKWPNWDWAASATSFLALRLLAAAACLWAYAACPACGADWAGTNSQGYPVTFTVDSAGKISNFTTKFSFADGPTIDFSQSGTNSTDVDDFSVSESGTYSGRLWSCGLDGAFSGPSSVQGTFGGIMFAPISSVDGSWTASGSSPNSLIQVIVPSSARAGTGLLAGQGSVSVQNAAGTEMTIRLSSSDTTEVTVAQSVTIPSGQTTASFDLMVPDDTDADGTQNATITAQFLGNSASDTITVIVPPTVIAVTPAAGSTIVSKSLNIDVTFSEPVVGVDASDMVLSGAAATRASVGTPTDCGSNTWRFPLSGLRGGTLQVDLAPDPGDIQNLTSDDLEPRPTRWNYPAIVPEKGNKLWDKRFGGTGSDECQSVQETSDGGYVLGGYSYSGAGGDKSEAGRGGDDYWIVKVDSSGNKVWDKRFGGTSNDWCYSAQETSDGGYILGGYSWSDAGGDMSEAGRGLDDYWIVKVDSTGSKLWDKRFGGSGYDECYSVQETSDGGYILGGYSGSDADGDKSEASRGGYDYWIVKVDNTGSKLWDKRFGGSNDDYCCSVQETSDGGYILGGYSWSGADGDKSEASRGQDDYWIVKVDSTGTTLWDKRFGGASHDRCYSIQETPDGGYILGGYSYSGVGGDKSEASRGGADYWIVKVDSTGTKLWDKRFGGTSNDWCYSVQATMDGNYILAGCPHSSAEGDISEAGRGGATDYWIVKVDGTGTKLWDRRFGGTDLDVCYGICETRDGGYVVGGNSSSGVGGDKSESCRGQNDFWIVRLETDDSDGDALPDVWENRYFGNPTNAAAGEDVDGDGFSNWQEYVADTDPTDYDSVLKMLAGDMEGGLLTICWKGGVNAWQYLQRKSDITSTGELWTTIYTNIPPTAVINTVIDAGRTNKSSYYRVKAERLPYW